MQKYINVDCMEFFKTLENNSVDLILTDIPYNGVNESTAQRTIYDYIKNP